MRSPDFAPVKAVIIHLSWKDALWIKICGSLWVIEKLDFVEMSGDLPSGWEERTSRSTGQTYFLNQVDNHLHFLAIATQDSYSFSLQNNRNGTGQRSQPQRLQLRFNQATPFLQASISVLLEGARLSSFGETQGLAQACQLASGSHHQNQGGATAH